MNDEKLYEIPSIIHEKFLSTDQTALREALGYVVIGDRWKRIRLFVNSDSMILRQHLYDMMEQFWLSMIGIQKEALSGEDILDLSFILHGAMAIIEQQKEQYSFDFINALPDRPLGQGILQTLEALMMKYQRKS